jgi:hypothetical protein
MAGMTLPPTLPPTLPLVREPRPAQYALGGSALEWQGYLAAVQQSAAKRARMHSTRAGRVGQSGWLALPSYPCIPALALR